MKHISAHLGNPQAKYTKCFAWFPKKVNDSWVWLDSFYIKTAQYKLPNNQIIINEVRLTKWDFILESFTQKRT